MRGEDVGGIGVHIASRALAKAGDREVVVTRTVTVWPRGRTSSSIHWARRAPRSSGRVGVVRGLDHLARSAVLTRGTCATRPGDGSHRPSRARGGRRTPGRGRAGARAHAPTGDGRAAGDRRGRGRRPHRARLARLALQGVGAVFLLWTAPPATAPAVVERLASHTRRVVFLSSPHQTPHPFFQQPNPAARLHAEIERLIAAAGLDSTFIRPGMFASNAQFWWGPAIRRRRRRPVALRRGRDGTYRRARRRGRGGARPV